MTDEELIARLREIQGQAGLFASEAADRIEALVKVRREDALELLAAHGQAQDAYEAQLKAEARAERLEAALPHCVGEAALEHMLDRKGIKHLLSQIKEEDPEVWREICEETGRAAIRAIGEARK